MIPFQLGRGERGCNILGWHHIHDMMTKPGKVSFVSLPCRV